MDTFLFLLLAFTILTIVYLANRVVKRDVLYSKLIMLYDKMEMVIIKNNLPISKEVRKYLERHKFFVVNPRYTDIEVVLVGKSNTTSEYINDVKINKNTVEILIPELIDISIEFEKTLDECVIHSAMSSPKFILFLAKRFISSLFLGLKENSMKAFKKKNYLRIFKLPHINYYYAADIPGQLA